MGPAPGGAVRSALVYAPAVDGDRQPRAGRGRALPLMVVASGLLLGASVAAAQDAPRTFPGQQTPRVQPAPPAPRAQTQPAPTTGPRVAPASTPEREPRLTADEHTCETLFEGEDDEGLDEREECFRDDDVRWRWQLAFFTGPTRESEWDDSLAARGYGPSDVLFGGETSLVRRLGSYVGLGARTGVRDLRWLHFERPAAAVFGWDLLLLAELRVAVGRKELFSLGVDLGAGLGIAFSRVNDGRATDVGWRLQGDGLLALRIVGPAAAIVRLGYDHFPVTIGDSLDARLGGFRVTLGIEVRE
jgi:hypothetical protein